MPVRLNALNALAKGSGFSSGGWLIAANARFDHRASAHLSLVDSAHRVTSQAVSPASAGGYDNASSVSLFRRPWGEPN